MRMKVILESGEFEESEIVVTLGKFQSLGYSSEKRWSIPVLSKTVLESNYFLLSREKYFLKTPYLLMLGEVTIHSFYMVMTTTELIIMK